MLNLVSETRPDGGHYPNSDDRHEESMSERQRARAAG